MAQANVLEYARYFKLTKPLTNDEIGECLLMFHAERHVWDQQASDAETFQHDSELLEIFDKAAQDIVLLTEENPLPPSPEVDVYLKSSGRLSDCDRFQFLRETAQTVLRKQDVKLPLPLLKIGGGNVDKDVTKIRKGIDVSRALKEVAQEWQTTSGLYQSKAVSFKNIQEEVLHLVREHSERTMKPEGCEVTVSCLYFLKQAIIDPIVGGQVNGAVAGAVPVPLGGPTLDQITFSKDDIDMCEQYEPFCESALPTSCDHDKDFDTSKHELTLCPCPASFSDIQNRINEVSETTEPEFDYPSTQDFWENFINADCFDDPTKADGSPQYPYREKDFQQMSTPDSQGTFKIALESDSSIDVSSTLPPEGTESHGKVEVRDQMKLTLPDLKGDHLQPRGLNFDELLRSATHFENFASTNSFSFSAILDMLPFKPPNMKEVMYDKVCSTSVILDRYLGRLSRVTSSTDMLYRNPRALMFDPWATEIEELQLDDFPLEEGVDNKSHVDFLQHDERLQTHHSFSRALLGSPSNSQTPSLLSQPTVKTPSPKSQSLGKRKRDNDQQAASKRITPTTNSPQAQDSLSDECWSIPLALERYECPSDSLLSFLYLRGKKFLRPAIPKLNEGVELADDPIQSTQSEHCLTSLKAFPSRNSSTSDTAAENFPLPKWTSLNNNRTIIVNNSLLQRKPLLIRYLEQREPDKLNLIFRELDIQQQKGPDLILDVDTCVIITSTQALDQRPLPGQKNWTAFSETHDTAATLIGIYSRVIVLVHYVQMPNASIPLKLIETLTDFPIFCQKYQANYGEFSRTILPLWLPCKSVISTAEVVNNWVWELVRKHGHQNNNFSKSGPSAFLQEETLWERFLKTIGIHPLAAQLMLGLLKTVDNSPRSDEERGNSVWGLRRLVAMRSEEMSKNFGEILSRATIEEMSRLLHDGKDTKYMTAAVHSQLSSRQI